MDLNPSVVEGAVCLTVDAAWEFAVDDDGGCGDLDSAVGGWMMKLHIPIVDQRIGTSDRRASPAYVQRVPKQAFPPPNRTFAGRRRRVGPALARAAFEGSFYPTAPHHHSSGHLPRSLPFSYLAHTRLSPIGCSPSCRPGVWHTLVSRGSCHTPVEPL
jgi:hypothetical protein